jgi:site-specific DNA-methyltransferase (adenine-specific)
MIIEHVPISSLKQDANNARKHSPKNLKAIKGSLRKFGQQKPIVVDGEGVVIAGNGTLAAAQEIGWTEIDVVRTALVGADAVAFALADNRTAELAEWDDAILGGALQALREGGFDIEAIGFDIKEALDAGNSGNGDPDDVPDEPAEVWVKVGDLFELGSHRLLCGDSTNREDVARLMNGAEADLVHTDPPYNVDYSNQDRPKAGKIDLGRIKNDKMEDDIFLQFLTSSLSLAFASCKDDSSIYIWYASKETLNFHVAAAAAGWAINQQIIWKKPMLLGRGRYQWAHEPCVFGVKGKPWFTDDRTKTTVWDFGGYDKSKNVHPTQKPVVVPEEAINNSSKIGSIVLDLFLGSGSTLIACEKTGRRCYGMELDPKYCQVILERWAKFSGKEWKQIDG